MQLQVWRLEHREWKNLDSGHFVGPFSGVYDAEHKARRVEKVNTFSYSCNESECIHNDVAQFGFANLTDAHPTPWEDGFDLEGASLHLVCGAQSLSALLLWFTYENLHQYFQWNFVVRSYFVPVSACHMLNTQVMFDSTQVECIAEYDSVRALREEGNT